MIKDELPPFEDDPRVIGKWVLYDTIPGKEYFSCSKKYGMEKEGYVLDELYFLPNGEGYYIFRGWSRGVIYTLGRPVGKAPTQGYEYEYIKGDDGGEYLIVGYYMTRGNTVVKRSDFPVYKKENDRAYTLDEIGIRDDMTHDFVVYDEVLGSWQVWDFVADPDLYDPR